MINATSLGGEIRSYYRFEKTGTCSVPAFPVPSLKGCSSKKNRKINPLKGSTKQREWSSSDVDFFNAWVRERAQLDRAERSSTNGSIHLKPQPPRFVVEASKDVFIPAKPSTGFLIDVASTEVTQCAPNQRELEWARELIRSIGGLGYIWTLSQADRNRLTHALNGNIIEWTFPFAANYLWTVATMFLGLPTFLYTAGTFIFNFSIMSAAAGFVQYLDLNEAIHFAATLTSDNELLAAAPVGTSYLLWFATGLVNLLITFQSLGLIFASPIVRNIITVFMTLLYSQLLLFNLVSLANIVSGLGFFFFLGSFFVNFFFYGSLFLGCLIFQFMLFYFILRVMYALVVFIEVISSRPQSFHTINVTFACTTVLSVLQIFVQLTSGENVINTDASLFLLSFTELNWRYWYIPAITHAVRWVLYAPLIIVGVFCLPFRWFYRFIVRTAQKVAGGAVDAFVSYQLWAFELPELAQFLALLPFYILFHLLDCQAGVKVLDVDDSRYQTVYNYVKARIIIALVAFFIVFPITLCSPIILFVLSWFVWIFILAIPVMCIAICLVPFSLGDGFLSVVYVFAPLIYNIMYTVTIQLRRSITRAKGRFSDSFMSSYLSHWSDAGSIMNQHRPVRYHYQGSWRIWTGRQSPPTDTDELASVFYTVVRRVNVPYLDVFIVSASAFTIIWVIATCIKKTFKSLHYVLDCFITALGISLITLFIPNIFYEFSLVQYTLFRQWLSYQYIELSADLATRKEDSWAYVLEHARFLRSVFRYLVLQAWFTAHYLTHDDIDLESEDQAKLDAFGEVPITSAYKAKRVNVLRAGIKRLIFKLEDFRLPEFIQAQYKSPTPASIRSTYETLKGLGFPIDQDFIDSIQRPTDDPFLDDWASLKSNIIAATDFKFNIPRFRVELAEELREFGFPEVPGYIHTTTYTSEAAEIESTARYFTGNNNRFMSLIEFNDVVDAAWSHVHVQYANSKLSSPSFIYKHWVKKYNMGFGFRTRKANGDWRQMRRAEAIQIMGGRKGFLRAWAEVFRLAAGLVGVAPVFTKMETLKLKKALNKQVRTVIGSAFVHSVLSYVFNFKPNHNYKPWENSSKVGMPINGLSFSRLFASLQKHDAVWAGDMTAFDSTVPPVIIRMVRDLRKKGYEHHKDFTKLSELIDIAYEQLIHQPLGFKSMGTIFEKDQGFTTGHTSTTPDNTLALLLCYLFAWRRVTGLRSREFFNFNTLANFGDDHVLGYDKVFGWSPEKAAEAMKELGIIMRDEGEGQTRLPGPKDPNCGRNMKITFLAKQPLWISDDVLQDLKLAGITEALPFAVCHDRTRLIGKIKGQAKIGGPLWRRNRLVSYVSLTAHHRDVYDSLISAIHRVDTRNAKLFERSGARLDPVPSYKDVVRKWYSGSFDASKLKDEITEHLSDEEKEFSLYESASPIDYLMRWFSDIPTLLSPRYANTRWADWVQTKTAAYINWPLSFVAFANGIQLDRNVLLELLARTPYGFLRANNISAHSPGTNPTTLFVRHYLYTIYHSYLRGSSSGYTLLNLLRTFDHAAINLYFALFGKVTSVLVEMDLHIVDTAILILLSFIHIPSIPIFELFITKLTPEAPSMFVGRIISMLVNKLAPNGSVDMQPFFAALDNLRIDDTLVVDAPTGTGKSTRMVDLIQRRIGRRVVVIQPRHLLVTGIVSYMNTIFPNTGIGGSTEGLTFQPDDRIVYCTPQSFLMSARLRDPNSLIILDEAHVNEPAYLMLDRYLSVNHYRCLYMTATPLPDWNYPVLRIPAINSFTCSRIDVTAEDVNAYIVKATRHVNTRGPYEKSLVFVNTLREAQRVAQLITVKACILSSKDKDIDPDACCYIATSVADAGITIPDVSIVHTMDVGISVSMIDVFRAPDIQLYRLPATTIRQRVGRTGRTNHGIVFLYSVQARNIVEQLPPFSGLDYINSLSQSIVSLYPIMPVHIQQAVAAILPSVAGLEHPEAFYTLTEFTYTEHDAIFALNSRELLTALSPAFVRGFRDVFDTLGDSALDLFSLPFEDIGLPSNPVPEAPSPQESEPPIVSSNPNALFNAQRFAEPGPQPETNYDEDPVPTLVLNDVGIKYFYGVKPSTADLGPAHIDADYPDLDSSSSSDDDSSDDEPDTIDRPPYRPPGYRPGHIDSYGVPHAYRPFETPQVYTKEDHLARLDRVIGTKRMRFGGTIVAAADISDLGPASLSIESESPPSSPEVEVFPETIEQAPLTPVPTPVAPLVDTPMTYPTLDTLPDFVPPTEEEIQAMIAEQLNFVNSYSAQSLDVPQEDSSSSDDESSSSSEEDGSGSSSEEEITVYPVGSVSHILYTAIGLDPEVFTQAAMDAWIHTIPETSLGNSNDYIARPRMFRFAIFLFSIFHRNPSYDFASTMNDCLSINGFAFTFFSGTARFDYRRFLDMYNNAYNTSP